MTSRETCSCGEDLRVHRGGVVVCSHCDRDHHADVPTEFCPRCKQLGRRGR